MHDGQNVFDDFVQDSYADHTWQAAKTADRLIHAGEIPPFILIGVSHGDDQRIKEYLPHYVTLKAKGELIFDPPLIGAADSVLAYYRSEVDPYVRHNYRVLPGRQHTATCGSSMGGLLSQYFAWEAPDFAQHHAILSPAYWLTQNEDGSNRMIERIEKVTRPDVRIWLDSGVEDMVGKGDDGMYLTMEMRDALLKLGFREGVDFHYMLDRNGIHHESSWARHLPDIFRFLFAG